MMTRGRVITAGAVKESGLDVAAGAAPRAAAAPTQRMIAADLVVAEATTMAEAIVKKAEAFLAEAQQQAASVLAEATREGHAQGAADWLWLHEERANDPKKRQEQVLMLAKVLAERLVYRTVDLDPSVILPMAREASASVAHARHVNVYANPADVETLRQRLDELGFESAVIRVRVDESLSRGGLRFETEVGTIDADIPGQLDRLIEALKRP